jgi:mannose-1-phosphate guanylyltransferase
VEKPDLETARQYVASKPIAGTAACSCSRHHGYWRPWKRFAPDIVSACRQAVDKGRSDLDFFRLEKQAFSACPSDSIDYAVMEKTDRGAMLPMAAGWNDLGSWEACGRLGKKTT